MVVVAFTFLTIIAIIFLISSRSHIAEESSLAEGCRKLIWQFVICYSIPFLIMGSGLLIDGLKASDFLQPPTGNPYVAAFYLYNLLSVTLGTYWLLVRGGAELIVRHRRLNIRSVAFLKIA
jgi:hypothetical protein